MQYAQLGRSGVTVSRLCLGTNNFGSFAGEADSFAMMDQALDLGINFFDTANQYGRRPGEGYTEQIIGRWLAQGGRRERIVLGSKVFGPMSDRPNDRGLSAYHIRAACDASLRRLQTDHIDLYQMHHVDPATPWEEVWQAMEQLIGAGKITYVGNSNFAAWNIVAANKAAARRNLLGLVSDQSLYSLADRTVELEVLPACQAYGIAAIPYSPLGGGILTGVLQRTDKGRTTDDQVQQRIARFRPQIERWEKLCAELGESPAVIGLAWMLAQPAVTAPIIGPRTCEQLAECTRALDVQLTDATMSRIDAIWPGPGGAAPEAYAW